MLELIVGAYCIDLFRFCTLTIRGHCSSDSETVKSAPYMHLQKNDGFVPHGFVIKALQAAILTLAISVCRITLTHPHSTRDANTQSRLEKNASEKFGKKTQRFQKGGAVTFAARAVSSVSIF